MTNPNPVVVRLWMTRLLEQEARHGETEAERASSREMLHKVRRDAAKMSGARTQTEWNRVKSYADRRWFEGSM